MELNDSLKTGIDWMDSQHAEFISRIERLIEAMREGRAVDDIATLLTKPSNFLTLSISRPSFLSCLAVPAKVVSSSMVRRSEKVIKKSNK